MADTSSIEWTDATWNPLVGCEHVSPGCDRCYAAGLASTRLRDTPTYAGLAVDGRFTGEVRLLPERLVDPLAWQKPRMVFVNSMSDLFHKDVPDKYVAWVFAVMALAGAHTFQVLTKRHARMRALLSTGAFRGMVDEWAGSMLSGLSTRNPMRRWIDLQEGGVVWPLPNVWLGVSVEDQTWADLRIPALLATPAAVRFLSCEPLLGPVERLYLTEAGQAGICYDIDGGWWHPPGSCPSCRPRVDWVIAGGESGPGARPCDLEWLRSLRDRCADAGVPYFVKQLGTATAKRLGASGKGHDLHDLPPDLRIRQYPTERGTAWPAR